MRGYCAECGIWAVVDDEDCCLECRQEEQDEEDEEEEDE